MTGGTEKSEHGVVCGRGCMEYNCGRGLVGDKLAPVTGENNVFRKSIGGGFREGGESGGMTECDAVLTS